MSLGIMLCNIVFNLKVVCDEPPHRSHVIDQ